MIIVAPKETDTNETRVSITPQTATELIKAGYTVKIESGAGEKSFFNDKHYKDVDVEIFGSKDVLFDGADIVLKVSSLLFLINCNLSRIRSRAGLFNTANDKSSSSSLILFIPIRSANGA